MTMRILRFLTFIIIAIGIIFIPVVSIGKVNQQNPTKDLKPANNVKLTYELNNLEKYEGDLFYKIQYPQFNNKYINEQINEQINYLLEDFRNNVVSNNNEKMMFKLSSDISIFKNNLLFIKFSIEKNYKNYPNPVKSYETFIIDLKTNKPVMIKDILNKGYEDLFYMVSKEYFLNTYGLTITKKSENYNDIKPDKNIYTKLFIKNDIAEIFIYNYKTKEETLLKMFLEKLIPYIKKEYMEEVTTQLTTKATTTTTVAITIKQSITTEKQTESTTKNIETTKATTKAQENNNIPSKRKIDKNKPMIALTFDDGPNGAITSKILDILEKNNSSATFFVNARRIEKDTNILKRIDNLGSQIGNHTANHKNLTKLTVEQIKFEINDVNKRVKKAINKEPSIVRVPYGAVNDVIKNNVDYPLIMWSIDTRDWHTKNAKKIQESILGKVKDGDIVLMHDLYSETAKACEVIIPKLVEQGFQLVTIDELFYYKGIDLKNKTSYFNAYK